MTLTQDIVVVVLATRHLTVRYTNTPLTHARSFSTALAPLLLAFLTDLFNGSLQRTSGYNAIGTRGDCGFAMSNIQTCPGIIACSGHGQCLGNPTYKCRCSDGWSGSDCGEQVPNTHTHIDSHTHAHKHARVACFSHTSCLLCI